MSIQKIIQSFVLNLQIFHQILVLSCTIMGYFSHTSFVVIQIANIEADSMCIKISEIVVPITIK